MTTQEPPKITFPCADYPIRVMGTAGAAFQAFVFSVFDQHAPGYDRDKVIIRPSRNGNYESVTIAIEATGTEQLEALFQALKADTRVKMVL